LDGTGSLVSRLSTMLSSLDPAPFTLLDTQGHLFLGSYSGSVSALDFGVSMATNAPWPLPRHDVGNRGSTAKPVISAPPAVSAVASPWVDGNRVRWTSTGALVDYAIYRSESPDLTQATRIGQALASASHLDDPTAVAGTPYFYWVLASNAVGVSPAAPPASVAGVTPTVRARMTLPAMGSTPPPVPVVRLDGSVVMGNGTGWSLSMDLDGRPLWTNRISSALVSQVVQMLSDATGQIFLGTANGVFRIAPDGSSFTKLASNTGLISLGPDGLLRFRAGQNFILRDPVGEIIGSPTPANGLELAGFVRSDGLAFARSASGVIHGLDATWASAWEAPPGESATATLLALGLDGSVFLAPTPQSLAALDASGNLMWRQPLESDTRFVFSAALGPLDKTLWVVSYAVDRTQTLRALDSASGSERWRFTGSLPASAPGQLSLPAVTDDHTVLLPDDHLLWALDGGTGAVRWGFEGSGQVGPPVIHEDGSIVFTSGDEVIVLRGSRPPAFSGWPMAGHDARGSRSQGALGGRDLVIAPTDGEAAGITLRADDGGAFIPLVSEDLRQWRPAQGAFRDSTTDLPAAGPSHSPRLEGTRQFFRGVSP
ncbi:MAG: PQQ-binding-like beta-propeller repeat protein, partial [Verrucomicrobia bacterium]|nr:PQQ-binding-like beta-propeller repeat protein [Verrucomicrobiota bacterium]